MYFVGNFRAIGTHLFFYPEVSARCVSVVAAAVVDVEEDSPLSV